MTSPAPAPALYLLVDADCPACGWPERRTPIDAPGSVFGCPKCPYESTERDA